MKLSHLEISHYRRCKKITIAIGSMHALVGANNAGKSTILRALDFLFNASTRTLNEEAFWNGDTTQSIRVEALFTDLSDTEKVQLRPYLRSDDTFKMSRVATKGESSSDGDEENEPGIKITQQYSKPQPAAEWLREDKITGASIAAWLKTPGILTVNGQSFSDFLGPAKKVGEWQQKAAEFTALHLRPEDYEDVWADNPKGYSGVLKATLPFFVLVPAVRDVAEEAKVSKTNPFGRLLGAVVGAITAEKKAELETAIQTVTRQLNRTGKEQRLPEIGRIEVELNRAVAGIFANCDLEIEFQTPTFETLMGAPRLFVDDGFRGQIEFKGHGLQRAVIFAILRNYADIMTGKGDLKRRTLILAVEEPELYMHPLAQRAIRKLFKEIASGGDQVVYTTHSALLVEVADFDEVIRIEGVPEPLEGGGSAVCTKCRQLPVEKMVEDEVSRHPGLRGRVTPTSIREHYSHAYNRSRNEGFFAKRVILVEGDTEEYSLPIYAAAMGIDFDLLGVSVVEAGGKGPMDRLYRVFNELGIPVFMLFDYDEGNTDPEIVKKSKELLTLVGEPTDVPNGFYLGQRAACFQKNWEQSLGVEVPDYTAIQGKAAQTLGSVAGKPIRARFMARELANRNPPFIPASIKAVIQQAITVECGASVLKAG